MKMMESLRESLPSLIQRYKLYTLICLPCSQLFSFITQSGQVLKVTQFQLEQWSTEGLCSNPQALVGIIDQMSVVQRRTGNKPYIVHGR